MNRGAIYDAQAGARRGPVVVLTRESAVPLLANVTVAAITTRIRGLMTEVPVDERHGPDRESVVNCDNLFTIPKSALERRRGELDPEATARLRTALMIALQLED
ncbi:MAG TPA: type II toxin-antitoxin system PemK/MazF family toxin [Gaiellaceae bacterium]